MAECTDRVVGKILAGWRYDISGIAPEMRGDYEAHFAECEHCRSRQKLHRGIDIGLMVLASASMIVFLLAYGVIRHFQPSHAFWLEIGALGGFLLSMLLPKTCGSRSPDSKKSCHSPLALRSSLLAPQAALPRLRPALANEESHVDAEPKLGSTQHRTDMQIQDRSQDATHTDLETNAHPGSGQ